MTTVTSEATAAERLAQWASGYTSADIPQEVAEASKLYMLDAVGVGLVALDDRVAVAARKVAAFLGEGDATVLGSNRRLAPTDAAFVNGTTVHAIDFDDMSFGGHATGCVMPAIFALGEGRGASGEEILTAFTVGMETFGRLAMNALPVDALHGLGWHPTGVFGVLAAAVASAKLLNLNTEDTRNTIGLAASFGAGLTGNFGTMTKPAHSGHAARSGVLAALMAQQGFTSSSRALDSDHGFAQAYSHAPGNWDEFCENLGAPLRISFRGPSIKQYPCCGGNHAALQTLLTMKERLGLTLDNVEEVQVHVFPRALIVLSYDRPENEYQAKFSLNFNMATALADGKPTPATYADDNVLRMRPIMDEKIRVLTDLEDPGKRPGAPVPPVRCRVTVKMKDGTVHEESAAYAHGSPDDPMTADEINGKFMTNATPALGAERAGVLSQAVRSMDRDTAAFWTAWRGLDAGVVRLSG